MILFSALLAACGGETAPGEGSAGAALCAEGMRPIGPAGAPLYCVDAWESSLKGYVRGMPEDDRAKVLSEGVTFSAEGVIPTFGLSYDQSVAACSRTPVLDAGGVEVGRKRLVTSREWRDAADGVIGEGGVRFPYGDTYTDGVCNTSEKAGVPGEPGLSPTGAFPGCVSAFGVYDMSGNVWEWSNPEIAIDVDGWFRVAAELGVDVKENSDGHLVTPPNHLQVLKIEVAGVERQALGRSADGRIRVKAKRQSWQHGADAFPKGYLMLYPHHNRRPGYINPNYLLPVQVRFEDDGLAWLEVLHAEDGAPLAEKVGCSNYQMFPDYCHNASGYLGHFHDFDGTIGFRCAAEPLPGRGDD